MTNFDPNEHMTQLKSKQGSQDYLEVKWRLVWFRSKYPNGTIDTEEVEVDLDRVVEVEAYVWNAEKRRSEKVIKQAKGYARFRTIANNGEGGRATGTKTETAADFPDFIEKAETGSVGRALAMLGFGTQFTGDELAEHDRIVDSPVGHSQQNGSASAPVPTPVAPTAPVNVPAEQHTTTTEPTTEQKQAKATEQQRASISKLCQHVNMSEPENLATLTYFEAKDLLTQLTAEYKQQRANLQVDAGASTPASITQSKALLDMIAKAKSRVEALDMIWQDAKRDAELRQVEDKDLTVQQVVAINKVIAQYEQRASGKAS